MLFHKAVTRFNAVHANSVGPMRGRECTQSWLGTPRASLAQAGHTSRQSMSLPLCKQGTASCMPLIAGKQPSIEKRADMPLHASMQS